jgi:flagellar biosynthetic protein FliQ
VNEGYVIELVRQMLMLVITVAGPVLIGALIVGVTVSIVQAATSIQEQSLTFLPKAMLAIGAVGIGGPWAIDQLVAFTSTMLREVARLSPGALG